jgi:hypothetical protein
MIGHVRCMWACENGRALHSVMVVLGAWWTSVGDLNVRQLWNLANDCLEWHRDSCGGPGFRCRLVALCAAVEGTDGGGPGGVIAHRDG